MSSKPAVTRNRTVADSRDARGRRLLLQEQAATRRKKLQAVADADRAQQRVRAAEQRISALRESQEELVQQIATVMTDTSMLESDRLRARQSLEQERVATAAALESASSVLLKHEDEAFEASKHAEGLDRALTRDRLDTRAAEAAEVREADLSASIAVQRARREQQLVRAAERRQEANAEAIAEATVAAAEEAGRRLLAATAGKEAARERVNKVFREVGPSEVRAEALAAEEREARTQSLLQLRRSLMAVEKDVRSSAANTRKRRQQKESAEAAEFDRLLREGKNPYAEFRQRHKDATEAKMAEEAKSAVERARLEMADAIVVEDAAMRRRDRLAKIRQREAASLAMPKSAGAAAGAYLSKHTRGGADVLDPTGRTARIDASAVTTMRTHAFGTGKVARQRPDILMHEKRRPEMRGVKPDERWLPRKLAHPDDATENDDDDDAAAASRSGLGDEAAAARGLKDLTPLEQRLMASANERLRAGRVGKQVVLGKEFKGYSMVSDPRRVEFKDFEPGQPHRIRLTLTNGSLSFVSFRINALPDAIADMFDIVFTPPGRMSAGTSLPITVHFRPPASLDDDIVSQLPVDTSTGPCPVPLLCTPKRALPRAISPVGTAGHVVRGEVAKASITLTNDGALPMLWELVDMGPADSMADPDKMKLIEHDSQGLLDDDDDDDDDSAGTCLVSTKHGGELCRAGDSPWYVRAKGRLAGYSKSVVRAECRPERSTPLGRCARMLSVRFRVDTAGDDGDGGTEEAAEAMLQTLGRTSATSAAARGKPKLSLSEEAEAIEAQDRARRDVTRRRARMRLKPVRLIFAANVQPLPLFVSPSEVDMRVCECPLPSGSPGVLPQTEDASPLYRGTVQLRNRGKTAIRAALSLPPALDRWIQLRPTSCYVQAPGTLPGAAPTDPGVFRVSMRLRPDAGLLTDPECRRFFHTITDLASVADLPSSRGDAVDKLCSPEQVASGETPGSACELTVPVTIRGSGQTLPVYFHMRAALCMGGLRITPWRVGAGKVPVGRAAGFPLRLTNLSLLPIRFGPSGARVPRGFAFASGTGQGVLLGGESTDAKVIFAPQSTETVAGALTLRTSHGSAHRIVVRGTGVRSLASLGATRLCLPATSPGESVEASVPVIATASVPVEVQIVGAGRSASAAGAVSNLPAGLTVSPAVFTLQPGERRLVRIVYEPTSLCLPEPSEAHLEDVADAASTAGSVGASAAEDEGKDASDAELVAEAAHDSEVVLKTSAAEAIDPGVRDTRLWIAVRPSGSTTASATTSGADETDQTDDNNDEAQSSSSRFDSEAAAPPTELGARGQLLALDLQTSVTAARLLVSPRVVRLGQVPAGREVTTTIKVECAGAVPVTVEATGLNPGGAFRVVNAPRMLQPGKSARLTIAFTPASSRVYTDQLRVRAAEGGGTMIVRLAGTGATPAVSLLAGAASTSAEATTADGVESKGDSQLKLLLGDIVCGDEARVAARLRNSSPFPMTYTVIAPDAVAYEVAAGAVSGRAGFSVTPAAGTAPPGVDLPLEIVLRTDAASHGKWLHWQWAVQVPNYEGPPLSIAARARVWQSPGFIVRESDTGATAPPSLRRVTDDVCGQTAIASESLSSTFDADGPDAVRLALDGTVAEAHAVFTVGCCSRPEGAETHPISFTVSKPAEEACPGAARIQISPESGTVQPGESVRVVLTVATAAAGDADSVGARRTDAAGALAMLLPETKPAREVLVPLMVELSGHGKKQQIAVAVDARLASV